MSSDDCTGRQADLLGELRVLRQRARTARHAYWFPLILFGLLIGALVSVLVLVNASKDDVGQNAVGVAV